MALLPTKIYPIPTTHYGLVRRQDQQNSKAIEECIAQSNKTPIEIKLCGFMGPDLEKKQDEAMECASKCKDKSCVNDCLTAANGFDVQAMMNSPFNQVGDKCQKENPTGKEHHKYDEVSCISKELNVPEEKIKEIRDCPESRCMSATSMNDFSTCVQECLKQGDELVKDDKKTTQDNNVKSQSEKNKSSISSDASSSQSQKSNASGSKSSTSTNSANDSGSFKVTTSGLVTASLIILSLLGSN